MELLGLVDIPVWALLLVAIIATYLVYYNWNHNAFDGYDLDGPSPPRTPITSFIWTIFYLCYYGVMSIDEELIKQYGKPGKKTIRLFSGNTPSILTTDEEIIKEVCIKKFNCFTDRLVIDIGDEINNTMLQNAKGSQWKRLRQLMSPAFSSGKLRRMSAHIDRCTNILVENIKENNGQSVELKPLLQCFAMDVIAATSFGLELNALKDSSNYFVKMGRKAFDISIFSPIFIFGFFFPFLKPIARAMKMKVFPSDVTNFFGNIIAQAIEERQDTTSEKVDFLQLLINAHNIKDEENDVTHQSINKIADVVSSEKGLTNLELKSQAILFFVAGFENIASTSTYVLYNLACHPEKQEKLYQEIITQMNGKDELDYNTLAEMKYLEYCVNETLRMFPLGFRINRICTQDVTVKDIPIKKGWNVNFAVFAMHRDPELWENPEEFMPERFEDPDSMGYKFMPFGLGPRNCIGMRLSMLEIKALVAGLVKIFKLTKTEETLFPFQFSKTKFVQPAKPLKIGIELRN